MGSIRVAMESQKHALLNEISRLSVAELKAAPSEEIAGKLAHKFSIELPILDETGIHAEQRDIDVAHDPSGLAFQLRQAGMDLGQSRVTKGTEITISVPFQGDAQIFRCHASSHTMEYPFGRIGQCAIIFCRQGNNLNAASVRREFDEWLGTIKRHLVGISQELGNFNQALLTAANNALWARLEKLKRDEGLMSGLGFGSPKPAS